MLVSLNADEPGVICQALGATLKRISKLPIKLLAIALSYEIWLSISKLIFPESGLGIEFPEILKMLQKGWVLTSVTWIHLCICARDILVFSPSIAIETISHENGDGI